VTLYTLVMRENPFDSVEDASTANYSIPLDVSIGLNTYMIMLHRFPDLSIVVVLHADFSIIYIVCG